MVAYKIKVAKDDDINQWDDFVDQCTTGSLFHKTTWLKAAADETKTDLIRLLCFKLLQVRSFESFDRETSFARSSCGVTWVAWVCWVACVHSVAWIGLVLHILFV